MSAVDSSRLLPVTLSETKGACLRVCTLHCVQGDNLPGSEAHPL